MTKEQLERECADANNALKTIRTLRRAAIRKAEAEVNAAFADRIKAGNARVVAAKAALNDHIDAMASHPWEGKRVFRVEVRRNRFSRAIIAHDRVEGIVEVCRTGTIMPLNRSYGRPCLGEAFVRSIKKDGKPGIAIASSWRNPFPGKWQLVEAQGIEAGTAETRTGSVHESPVPEGDAPDA